MFIKTAASKCGPQDLEHETQDLSGVFQNQNHFHNSTGTGICCFFPTVDNCADGVKTMMDKIADALT